MALPNTTNDVTTRRLGTAISSLWTKIKNTFQTIGNKVTSWSSTPSDTKYPSEKLVKDALDANVSSIKKHGSTITPASGVADIGYMPVTEGQTSATVQNLIQSLRVKPGGRMGSVNVQTSIVDSTTIPGAWYNYIWIPHQTGSASGDLQNYGTLLLSPLTTAPLLYIVEGSALNGSAPTYRATLIKEDHSHYWFKSEAPSKLQNVNDYYQCISATTSDFAGLVKLYDVTEFFDGTIVNQNERSVFFGDVSLIREGGNAGCKYARVCAMIGYASNQVILQSDDDNAYPVLVKEDFERLDVSGTVGAYVISNNVATLDTTKTKARYFVVDCSEYSRVFINAGFYNASGVYGDTVKAYIFANDGGSVLGNSTGPNFDGYVDVPAGATKLYLHTNSGYSQVSVGPTTNSPKYFLAMRYVNGWPAGKIEHFGRFYTRVTASASFKARPLLLTYVQCFQPVGYTSIPTGYVIQKSASYTTHANSSNKLATARKLAVSLSNTSTDTSFDGSADVTNIKTTGTLAVGNGGTGKTTARDACNSFINALDYGSSTPVDADYYISQYVGGGTTTTTYHRRPMSALWTYIKGKLTSVSGVNISGNAATATTAQDYDTSTGTIKTALDGKVSKSGDTMTGKLTMEQPIGQIITGTGITASSSGSPTTYYPAKWDFDLGIATPTAGDRIVIKTPCAGHDYGIWMSTDNGTTYYPVARNIGTSRLTTHYPAGAYICVIFEEYIASNTNCGAVNDMFPVAGGTARQNTRIGCWRVINDYDSGNTYDRTYTANGRFYAGLTGCTQYSLVCLDSDGKFSMLVSSGSGTGTSKTINTTGKFKLNAVIFYYTGNATAANALAASTYGTYISYPNLDTRYSHNHSTTFALNSPLYIECTIDDDGFWSPTEKCITQTLEAGYYYIYLGQTYSTEYQLSLVPSHPLYYYDGVNLTEKPRLSKADSDRIDAIAEELDNKVDVDDLDFTGNATQENDRLIFEDIIFDSIYPTLGKYGLATFPETTAVDATEFSGDREWLLDWRPYLVDMSPVAGETAKVPVAELRKDNWLRTVNGGYAPVCGITSAQAAALNGKKDTLYWKTGSAGDKVSVTVPAAFDASGNFVPAALWEYVKGNLAAVNTAAGVTYAAPIEVKVYVGSQAYAYGAYTDYHIPAPWETTETKYSVFIGRKTDVYVVDGYSATTGEHMRGLCSKPLPVGTNQFDPEDFKLKRTGISPGPSTVVSSKIRNFFYNYVTAASANCTVKGGAGSLSILYDNGTYPATNGPNQYRCADWCRACNSGGSAGNAVPVGEMGYHSLNAFLCSLESAYGTRNLWAPTAFSTGNSSNDACGTAAQYRTNGGFWVKAGSGGVNYMTYAGNMKTAIGASSDAYVYNVVNGQYAHFQCMEPQIAASLAVEMGIGASTGAGNNEFAWNGGKWHYELPTVSGVVGLGSGAMNCRIYKEVEFSGKTIASIANCSGGTMLRCALAEGVNRLYQLQVLVLPGTGPV